MLKQALAKNGLIAILRGLRPQEAQAIGKVLYDAGFRTLEVPLNSPEPYESIRILRSTLPADCLVGAGTVLTPAQVELVKAAGGQVGLPGMTTELHYALKLAFGAAGNLLFQRFGG